MNVFFFFILCFAAVLAVFPQWAINEYSNEKEFENLLAWEFWKLRTKLKEVTKDVFQNYRNYKIKEIHDRMEDILVYRNALLEKQGHIREQLIDLHFLSVYAAETIVGRALGIAERIYHENESNPELGVLYFMTGVGREKDQRSKLYKMVEKALISRGMEIPFLENPGIIAAVFEPKNKKNPFPKANEMIGCIPQQKASGTNTPSMKYATATDLSLEEFDVDEELQANDRIIINDNNNN